ncbi:hypothetical protein CC78DRAFT_574500 [Lojkania enalia]|uniref:Mitochondrial ATPase inhibitor n=1 Tax=Lojkania enalia TaxID=147567 RepID=A0A9P4NAH8_9PLEO|nr:hypothetical protein CC78DRAFT_574500 [Didymosphaeria enalia]
MPLRPLISVSSLRIATMTSLPRAISTTPRLLIKEDEDRSPEQIEKKKEDQLKAQERGEGHWHEELASQAESKVAADRENVRDHESRMSKLQEQTKKKGEKGELE